MLQIVIIVVALHGFHHDVVGRLLTHELRGEWTTTNMVVVGHVLLLLVIVGGSGVVRGTQELMVLLGHLVEGLLGREERTGTVVGIRSCEEMVLQLVIVISCRVRSR